MTATPTFEELQAASEANWARVDAGLRDKCVWLLREEIPPQVQDELRAAFFAQEMPPFFHFGLGMSIRNMLRKYGAADGQLPAIAYGEGVYEQNWDDFYMAALRQAVLPREGEV